MGTLQVTSHQLGHFQSYVSSFQSSIAEYVPETVTSCCTQWQAVGVWFRIASQSKHFRPPSRPANGTSNTLSVQGRVLVLQVLLLASSLVLQVIKRNFAQHQRSSGGEGTLLKPQTALFARGRHVVKTLPVRGLQLEFPTTHSSHCTAQVRSAPTSSQHLLTAPPLVLWCKCNPINPMKRRQ